MKINKYIILLLFYNISIDFVWSNNLIQDTIVFSKNNGLTFSDFKGLPNNQSKRMATSSLEILYKYDPKNKILTVVSNFSRTESWMKLKTDTTLLLHEQIHFNITELFARKFREQVSMNLFIKKTLALDLQKQYDKIYSELDALQGLYDKETNFSNNYKCQEEWNKYIDQMLKELEAYSNPEVKLRFKEE